MTAAPDRPDLYRRNLLRALSLAPAGVALSAPAWAQDKAAAVGLISANVCLLQPEVTEGPYYIDPDLVRSDVTEGRPGVPLELKMQVVDADCTPVEGASVDIWHCDAQGNYSGFSGQGSDTVADTDGQTFLRGTQPTGADGVCAFRTIWPGWYRGRTPHVHYKVFLGERTVLTGQVFFPDALSQYIYDTAPDYAREGGRDTWNRTDTIAEQAGDGAQAAVREQPDRYVAALVVGIDRSATSSQGGTGDRPAGPPPGGPGQGAPGEGAPGESGPGGPRPRSGGDAPSLLPGDDA